MGRGRPSGCPRRCLPYCSPAWQLPPRPRHPPAAAARLARTAGRRTPLPQRVPRRLAAAPDPRVQHHASGAAAGAAPAAELRRAGDPHDWPSTSPGRFPARPPGSARALAAAGWFREQLASYGLPVGGDTWTQTRAGSRQGAAAEPLGVRARAVAGRDRRHGAPRQHGDRAGGERRRVGHRRADRARAQLRPDEHRRNRTPPRGPRAPGAHARLPLDRRRCVRRPRRASGSRAAAVPRRRDGQPCCDRRHAARRAS